jgi:hypothetical protein
MDTEVPISSMEVGTGKAALNKVAWSRDGRKVALGAESYTYVYDMGKVCRLLFCFLSFNMEMILMIWVFSMYFRYLNHILTKV